MIGFCCNMGIAYVVTYISAYVIAYAHKYMITYVVLLSQEELEFAHAGGTVWMWGLGEPLRAGPKNRLLP